VRIDDNSLNASITDIASQNAMTLAEFRTKLEGEKQGSYGQVREQIRREMMISRLRNKRVGDRIHITEQDIDNFLASPQSELALETEYRLAHLTINVPESASPQDWASAKQNIEACLATITRR
jgi:peptidyl-prolyl cis-trans isomerase SurA